MRHCALVNLELHLVSPRSSARRNMPYQVIPRPRCRQAPRPVGEAISAKPTPRYCVPMPSSAPSRSSRPISTSRDSPRQSRPCPRGCGSCSARRDRGSGPCRRGRRRRPCPAGGAQRQSRPGPSGRVAWCRGRRRWRRGRRRGSRTRSARSPGRVKVSKRVLLLAVVGWESWESRRLPCSAEGGGGGKESEEVHQLGGQQTLT